MMTEPIHAPSPLAPVPGTAHTMLARHTDPARPVHRRVTGLLGMMLALSARSRRASLPEVSVAVDVFGPSGTRALRLFMPVRD